MFGRAVPEEVDSISNLIKALAEYETNMKKPFINRKMIIMRVPSDLNEKL
ncbi:hypothetical protein BMS3Abin03_01386 [bacterium BMS3Abin03]|nr:hypothetical protein BMS3Abin03_01386 [bacterium BMS3Abin03]